MQKPTAIILELDFAVARLDGGLDAMYAALAPLGIPSHEARKAFRRASDTAEGFGFEAYANALAKESVRVEEKAIVAALKSLYGNAYGLYSDVRGFLDAAREQNIPVVLMAGNKTEFEQMRVACLEFPFDQTVFAATAKIPGDHVYRFQQAESGSNVWYVSGRRRDLVRIAETPKVKKALVDLIEIDRPDRSHKETKQDPRFRSVTVLTSLIAHL